MIAFVKEIKKTSRQTFQLTAHISTKIISETFVEHGLNADNPASKKAAILPFAPFAPKRQGARLFDLSQHVFVSLRPTRFVSLRPTRFHQPPTTTFF